MSLVTNKLLYLFETFKSFETSERFESFESLDSFETFEGFERLETFEWFESFSVFESFTPPKAFAVLGFFKLASISNRLGIPARLKTRERRLTEGPSLLVPDSRGMDGRGKRRARL